MSIRLLIVEDHPWIREGLRAVLSNTEVEIVDEVTNGDEAIGRAVLNDFDVMLLDIKIPGKDGFDVLEAVKSLRPDLPVLIFSHYTRWDFQERARQLAASGYVLKSAGKDVLVAAIRKASQGEMLWQSTDARPLHANGVQPC